MYYCRKGFSAVNVLVVCNSDCKFTNCRVGYSGRAHDSTVLMSSALWRSIQGDSLGQSLNDISVDIQGVTVPGALIADSAYKCLPHLLPAFKNSEATSSAQRSHFNKQHAKTRNPVERAIGRLKARFRKLLHGLEVKIDNCWAIIMACIVLHNICEDRGLQVEEDDDDLADLLAQYEEDFVPLPIPSVPIVHTLSVGQGIRNALVLHVNS
jgi:hypothetical protein